MNPMFYHLLRAGIPVLVAVAASASFAGTPTDAPGTRATDPVATSVAQASSQDAQPTECRSWFARSAYPATYRPNPAQLGQAGNLAENSPSDELEGYIAATSSMHGCTADNRSYHGSGIDFVIHGERVSLKLRATDYPEEEVALDEALKVRAHDGISKEDADFALDRLLPALAEIPSLTDADERDKLIARAKSLWKDYLLKATAFIEPIPSAAAAAKPASLATPSKTAPAAPTQL